MLEIMFSNEQFEFFKKYKKLYLVRVSIVAISILIFYYFNENFIKSFLIVFFIEMYVVDLYTTRCLKPACYMPKKMKKLPLYSMEVTKHFLIMNGLTLLFILSILVFKI